MQVLIRDVATGNAVGAVIGPMQIMDIASLRGSNRSEHDRSKYFQNVIAYACQDPIDRLNGTVILFPKSKELREHYHNKYNFSDLLNFVRCTKSTSKQLIKTYLTQVK